MITVENIPYISLGVVSIGFVIVIIGILLLAYQHKEETSHTTHVGQYGEENRIEELFSYFLQEEEKKNNALRESLHIRRKEQVHSKNEEQLIKDIAKQHDEGKTPEEIAKALKIGVGEVQLILSLYNMR